MNKPQPTSDDIEGVAKEYALAEAQLVQAREAMKPIREKLLGMFLRQPGEASLEAGKWRIIVDFPEKTTWDSEQIEAIYGAQMPTFIQRSFSVKAADLKRLPTAERDQLNRAKQEGVGSPKITVEVV